MATQAFKYLREILAFPGLAALTIGPDNGEISPGAAIQSDEDILA
jgi:choline dehydrogenase